ncbi:hypothetical protein B0T16DRAFT_508089 [Cercophora newfieldiana]|uniref:SET domain-containing protein n=1 Tax=Cercophora newfieldiana TaxID=92897 RepID=A0AA40CUD5_9PEZI|nr:hypothetical protein B0T16DRAFT_508089 [Cercophora newfieldiana]
MWQVLASPGYLHPTTRLYKRTSHNRPNPNTQTNKHAIGNQTMAPFPPLKPPSHLTLPFLLLTLMTPSLSLSLMTPSPSTCLWTPHGAAYPLPALASGTCPASGPWSRPPSCPDPPNKHIGGDEPDDCIFIHSTFRSGQGLAIISSPSVAAALAEALDDGIAPYPPQEKEKRYSVVTTPGRGKGVVLTAPAAKHETVLTGHPVLIVRWDWMASERFGAELRERMLSEAVGALPAETRRAIEGLARSGGRGKKDGVFWRYSARSMTMEMVAVRDLKAGEEIVHTLRREDIPLGYTMQERQLMLKPWGFKCACSMCRASPQEIAASDDRRERLFEIHQTLTSAIEESSLPRERIDAIVREGSVLIEREGLDPLIEYMFVFSRAYMSINEVKLARRYAQLAEAKLKLYEGEENAKNSEALQKLCKELKELEREVDEDDW